MIDESLLKSNFIGRDGFRWWIGQIPPEESMSEQLNKDGWGNRTKVRILGYHPYDDGELPNEELPWAQILLSTTDGSGASNMATNHKIRPGDVVFGFFLDGDNAQIPVISGVFGRTDQVPTTTYTSPYVTFTVFTSRIENDGSRLKANEVNEQTPTTQESPVHRPPSTANASNQISYSSVIGDTVYFATAQTDSKMNKIATELENAIKFLQDIQSYPNVAQEWINTKRDQLCEEITEKIKGITTEIISGVVNDSYEQLIPVLNEATELLYDFVYQPLLIATGSTSTSHLGAGLAQNATIQPVEELQKLIPCLIASIIDAIADLLGDIICSILENVASFASCVIDQFLGGLLNSIINLVISGMQSVLGALSILLNFTGFNIADAIRQTAEGLFGIPLSINCGEGLGDLADNVSKWTIGSGAQLSSSFDVDNILNLANQSNVGSLDACVPVIPSAPKFNIFGGRGSGASASPVFGSIRGEGNNRTASIIGAIVTSGGSGYTNPPFVTIRDDTNNGYGFSGRTILDGDEVVGVIVNSPGENYPVGNQPTPSDIIGTGGTPVIAGGTGGTPLTAGGTGGTPVTAGGTTVTAGGTGGTPVTAGGTGGTLVTAGGTGITDLITVDKIFIENPGFNYQETDVVTDNFGNEYNMVIDNGSIVNVTPINIKEITDLPYIKIISKTGSGARLKPIFGFRKDFTGQVAQVIDCIT
ncbi:MAG: hypothetical protein ACO3UU_01815 [Minisyncoccia bacterium]